LNPPEHVETASNGRSRPKNGHLASHTAPEISVASNRACGVLRAQPVCVQWDARTTAVLVRKQSHGVACQTAATDLRRGPRSLAFKTSIRLWSLRSLCPQSIFPTLKRKRKGVRLDSAGFVLLGAESQQHETRRGRTRQSTGAKDPLMPIAGPARTGRWSDSLELAVAR